nr:myrosinase 1-like [Onthophagus taurus]
MVMKNHLGIMSYILLMCICMSYAKPSIPDTLQFGVATSAYQVEGAWNEGEKGENQWDRLTHGKPQKIKDKSNADITCDSYHKFMDDVQLLKAMNVDFYKFSISWSRIFPTGYTNSINADGIRYYNDLIDELIVNGIKPVATMFHWDLPQALQEKGGWMNEQLIDVFETYANLLFSIYGNKVRDWITFDDPNRFCFDNYYQEVTFADGLIHEGNSGYLCAHTVLRSHGRVYKIYNTRYRTRQRGRIGISLGATWMERGLKSESDVELSRLAMEIELGWFAHPIFSKEGDYPPELAKQLEMFAQRQQMTTFKLPDFPKDEVELIRGSADFIGLSHFISKICDGSRPNINQEGNHFFGIDFCTEHRTPRPTGVSWVNPVPWGIKNLLKWVKEEYNSPEIFITANGYPDSGNEHDCRRVHYMNVYLEHVAAAIEEDGCNVTAYTVWSLLDNFNWYKGYTEKYGLYRVDFTNPERPRKPKLSSVTYANIIKTRKIDWGFSPEHYRECRWNRLNETED